MAWRYSKVHRAGEVTLTDRQADRQAGRQAGAGVP